MKNSKKKVKESLIEATEAVRNKFKRLRSNDLESTRLLEEQYKPITKRLGQFIHANGSNASLSKDDIPTQSPPPRSTLHRNNHDDDDDDDNIRPRRRLKRNVSTPQQRQLSQASRISDFKTLPILTNTPSFTPTAIDSAVGIEGSSAHATNVIESINTRGVPDLSYNPGEGTSSASSSKMQRALPSVKRHHSLSDIKLQMEDENRVQNTASTAVIKGDSDPMDLDVSWTVPLPMDHSDDDTNDNNVEMLQRKPFRRRESGSRDTPLTKKIVLSHLSNRQKESARAARQKYLKQNSQGFLEKVKMDRAYRVARAKDRYRRDVDLQEIRKQMVNEGKSMKQAAIDVAHAAVATNATADDVGGKVLPLSFNIGETPSALGEKRRKPYTYIPISSERSKRKRKSIPQKLPNIGEPPRKKIVAEDDVLLPLPNPTKTPVVKLQRISDQHYQRLVGIPPEIEQPARRVTRSQSVDGQQLLKNYVEKKAKKGKGIVDTTVKEFHIDGSGACKNMFSYWNDPNELVQRLRLLISSTSVGHTGHQNEIVSIIEQLREVNIIE